MAVDNNRRLIWALIAEKDLTVCTDRGVRPEWFDEGSDERLLYAYITDFHVKYGSFPSLATLKAEFPSFEIRSVEDPLTYFVDELVSLRRWEASQETAEEVVQHIEEGHVESAIEAMTVDLPSKLSEFSPVPVYQTDLTKTGQERVDSYLARKAKGSPMIGLESGYPTIDRATLGFQPEQLIVLVASSKTGKSSLCMEMCKNVHEKYNESILFVSFEMTRRELGDRHDATRAKVPLSRFLNGTLVTSQEEAMFDMLDDMETRAPFVIADSSEGVTLESVQSRVQAVNPALVVIDGVYLMKDQITGESNTPQALTNLTRGMKRLAQQEKIPVIISTQALRSKMGRGRVIGADSAGYTSSFSQDADVLLGLEEVEHADDRRMLRVVMSRNSGPTEVEIDFDYERAEFGEI